MAELVSSSVVPISWKMLKESGFDRDAYPNCDRFGAWQAAVDAVAYSRGKRVKADGKGALAGIHLFVRSEDDGRKSWLYVFFFPGSEMYEQAKGLKAGDRVRVETVHGKDDHATVKLLEKLR
ncbi:hypothetical protein BH09VER1_BH09VER1_11730 [soil metagenome]